VFDNYTKNKTMTNNLTDMIFDLAPRV